MLFICLLYHNDFLTLYTEWFSSYFLLRDSATQEYIIITIHRLCEVDKFRIVESVNHLEMQFFPKKFVECRRLVLHIIGS